MSKDLRLNLILGHLETLTAPLKKIQGGSNKAADALRKQRQQLRQLQAQQRDISSFKKQQTATRKSSDELNNARYNVERLQAQINKTTKPTKGMVKQFEMARKNAAKLEKQHQLNRSKLIGLQKSIKDAGGSTRKLAQHENKLADNLKRTNAQLEKQKRHLDAVNRRQKQLANLKSAAGNMRGHIGSLTTQGLVAGAGAGYLFKTQFLDTAAMFEDYQAVLRAVEGSNEKAKQSMKWVSDFAATTPYELAEVTEAYKQLRAYGMDPTTGLLKDLGDAASAMNKPVLQAVEAIADAITGENERLKEFGIRANTEGQNIIYEYTDRMGRQRQALVDKNNRAEIESTLRTIWNDKYAGSMKERSKTWRGMVSNLSDQWTRFTNMVMENGLFDWMKNKLETLLDKVNQMAADGSLQAYAKDVGEKLVKFATGLWAAIEGISSATAAIADMVGGWDNLIYILAGVKLAGIIGSFVSLAAAIAPIGASLLPGILVGLKAISAFMLANPVLLALAGVSLAGIAVYKNWDSLKSLIGEGEGKVDKHGKRITRYKRHEPIRMRPPKAPNVTTVEKIEVHPSPGMDERRLAQMVNEEIQKVQRSNAVSARSSLRDED